MSSCLVLLLASPTVNVNLHVRYMSVQRCSGGAALYLSSTPWACGPCHSMPVTAGCRLYTMYLSNLLTIVYYANKHRVEHHVFIILTVLILVNHRISSSNNLNMQ